MILFCVCNVLKFDCWDIKNIPQTHDLDVLFCFFFFLLFVSAHLGTKPQCLGDWWEPEKVCLNVSNNQTTLGPSIAASDLCPSTHVSKQNSHQMKSFSILSVVVFYLLCVYLNTQVSTISKSKSMQLSRTIYRSQFSLSILWVQGCKPRSSDLVLHLLSTELSCQPCVVFLFLSTQRIMLIF